MLIVARTSRLFSLMAVLALALALPASAENAAPLVSTGWLKQHLKDPDVLVLDIRSAIDSGGVEAYQQAHIPGAIHSDYDKAGWRVTRGGVPFMLPTLPELEKLIGELGIDEDTHVVVVPAGVHYTDFGAAARTYWTLKVTGVAKVSILDGGVAAWSRDGNATESGPSKPSPKIFTASLNKALLTEANEVQKIEQTGGATLIDAAALEHALTQVLRIALDGTLEPAEATPGLKALLMNAAGVDDFAKLETRLTTVQAATRDSLNRILS